MCNMLCLTVSVVKMTACHSSRVRDKNGSLMESSTENS